MIVSEERDIEIAEFLASDTARVITGNEMSYITPEPKARPANWKRDKRAKNKAARASRKRNRRSR